MKKLFFSVVLCALFLACFGMAAQAKVGDVIGEALHTDIIVRINNYPVSSYAVNGQSVIVAEDLRNFGFDVVWNQDTRSLALSRNNNPNATPAFVKKGYPTGQKYTDILETDITVWANGQKLTSYAMNGRTMIPVEELTMFGTVTWDSKERMLMMEIENLEKPWDWSSAPVAYPFYENSDVPSFGWVTEKYCDNQWVKIYTEGKRISASYHDISEGDVMKYIAYLAERGWHLVSTECNNSSWWLVWEYNLENAEMNGSMELSLDQGGTFSLWTTIIF